MAVSPKWAELPSPLWMSHHRWAVGVLDGWGARDGREAKIRRFFAPDWPHGRHPHVRVCRYHWSLVGVTMIWIMFGVGTALGVAIGACVATLIIGWWDRDADGTVRRRNS